MKSTAQIEAERKRRAAEELKQIAQQRIDIRAIMAKPEGRGLLWNILSFCELYSDGYSDSPGYRDHITGKRNVGIRIIELLNDADPTIYPRLLMENANDRRTDSTYDGSDSAE